MTDEQLQAMADDDLIQAFATCVVGTLDGSSRDWDMRATIEHELLRRLAERESLTAELRAWRLAAGDTTSYDVALAGAGALE